MPRGGYQRPSNPAPVSGPGALSRRTDGGPAQGAKYMAGGKYGEGQQLMQQQKSAPMSGGPAKPKPAAPANPNLSGIVPLTAPTQRPDEPLTAGSPFGPGPGREILTTANQNKRTSDVISKLVQYDDTGQLSEFYNYLISRGL